MCRESTEAEEAPLLLDHSLQQILAAVDDCSSNSEQEEGCAVLELPSEQRSNSSLGQIRREAGRLIR